MATSDPFLLKNTTFHIALGSNLGDRLNYLQSAILALHQTKTIHLERVSSVYESPAHVLAGAVPQPDYLNAVCCGRTSLYALDLLTTCLAVEKRFGRTRLAEPKWQARTLDLDLLNWGSQVLNTPDLVLPHPRIAERRFVLDPLSEIAPNLQLPSPYNCSVEYLQLHCPDLNGARKTSLELIIPNAG